MSVPKIGTYLSADGNFKIAITAADPSNGQIQAIYETNYSPIGGFKVEGQIGNYAWVSSAGHPGGGTAPFSIRFSAGQRPDGRPYAIQDSWTGAYQIGDALLMDGSRSYVNEQGVIEVVSLGTVTFSL